MTVTIIPRRLPYSGVLVFDCTIGDRPVVWRATPADAYRDALAAAGAVGGYVIPRSVSTADLYAGPVTFAAPAEVAS